PASRERAPERDRGGDGGLPDATAPGRDDDPVPLDQLAQRHDDLERGRAAASARPAIPASSRRATCSSSARANSSTKRNGSSTSGASPLPARRRARLAALMSDHPLSSAARSATQWSSARGGAGAAFAAARRRSTARSEEHTSELQS